MTLWRGINTRFKNILCSDLRGSANPLMMLKNKHRQSSYHWVLNHFYFPINWTWLNLTQPSIFTQTNSNVQLWTKQTINVNFWAVSLYLCPQYQALSSLNLLHSFSKNLSSVTECTIQVNDQNNIGFFLYLSSIISS